MLNEVRQGIKGIRSKLLNGVGDIISDVGPLSFFSQWFNPNNLVGELEQLEKYTGITYACISAIAEDVARIKFTMAKKAKDGTLIPIKADNPFLDLLKNPNPTQSDYEFIEMTQTHIELTGEAFWYCPKGKISGKPKEFWIMRPDLVQIVYDQNTGEVTGYVFHKWNGRVQVPLDLDEVVHFKMPNPINPYRGMGTVQAGMVYIQTEEFTSRFSRNYIANNATPSGIVNFKGTIPDPEFQKIKRQWTNQYGGVENAGKTAFLRNVDASFEKIGSSLQDIDLTALKNLTRDDIMFMFRVSKPILGITEDVNYASAKTAEYIFAKRVVDPKMNRIVDTLQTFYNLKYKDDLIVTYESPIPQDNDEKIAYLKGMLGPTMPMLTANEARAIEGYPPIEGGDKLMVPVNLIPLQEAEQDTAGTAATAPGSTTDDEDPNDGSSTSEDDNDDNNGGADNDSDDNSDTDDNGAGTDIPDDSGNKGGKGIIKRRIRVTLKKKSNKILRPLALSEAAKESHRIGLVQLATAYSPQVNHAIKEAVAKQRLKFIGQLVNTKPRVKGKDASDDDSSTDQPDPESLDFGDAQVASQMTNNIMPVLIELMQQAGKAGMGLIDPGIQYELSQASIDRITQRVEMVAADYTADTKAALIETIKNGYTQGLSLADMSGEIDNVFQQAMGYRSLRIARTETMHEANAAANDAYIQSGYVVGKEWYAGGVDPCQFCEALNGTIVETETVFVEKGGTIDGVDGGVYAADYSDISAGDAHPNCMCTILPVTLTS